MMLGSCEHGNELLGSKKHAEFFYLCQQENLKERQHLEDLGMDGRIS
jgi:hypothetical protein